jgi:hypothetical protein
VIEDTDPAEFVNPALLVAMLSTKARLFLGTLQLPRPRFRRRLASGGSQRPVAFRILAGCRSTNAP